MNICDGPERYLYVPDPPPGAPAAPPPPPPPPDPAVLAQQAYTELTVPKPAARRSPPETNSDPDNGGPALHLAGTAHVGMGEQLAAVAAHGGSAWGVGDGDRDPDVAVF